MTQLAAMPRTTLHAFACPVCSSDSVESLVRFDSLPVFCNVLHQSRELALAAPRAPMDLAVCDSCSHIFNASFDADLLAYSAGYENALHHSGTFMDYQDWLVRKLVDDYRLRQKRVVEIGCGQGDFLSALCVAGENSGIGFDPSYVRVSALPGIERVEPRYFAAADAKQADAIVCRQVLEHIEAPAEFLRGIRESIGPGKLALFEVPNGKWCFGGGGIWDVIYEHCGYFTESSLRALFTHQGFRVEEIAKTFGGQFLTIVATTGGGALGAVATDADGQLSGEVQQLKRAARAILREHDAWRSKLHALADRPGPVVIWGAGSKGVTFLNIADSQRSIEFAVDLNPRKAGRYIPGTGQLVISPEQLVVINPGTVIVMNPNYEAEVAKRLKDLSLTPDLVLTSHV